MRTEAKYDALVRHVLYMYDLNVRLGTGSDRAKGEIEGLRGVLHWVQGYEQVDLEGLREKFKEA